MKQHALKQAAAEACLQRLLVAWERGDLVCEEPEAAIGVAAKRPSWQSV